VRWGGIIDLKKGKKIIVNWKIKRLTIGRIDIKKKRKEGKDKKRRAQRLKNVLNNSKL